MSNMSEEPEKIEVEIEETQSEEQSQQEQKEVRLKSTNESTKESVTEGELDNYTEGVKKRINKLAQKYREEEKRAQELDARAKKLQEENDKLKNRMKQLDQGFLSQVGARLETQENALKQAHKEAYDSGDTDRMFEISQQLAVIVNEKQKYQNAKRKNENARVQVQQQEPQQQAPAQQYQQQAPKKVDPRAQSWAEKNEWFGENSVMTAAAFAIHNSLVEEAFDPNSDEYYSELDSRIQSEFPHKFPKAKKSGGGQVASASSSASRANKQGRRSVKLTPSAVDIANRLGVPLETYAQYVKE